MENKIKLKYVSEKIKTIISCGLVLTTLASCSVKNTNEVKITDTTEPTTSTQLFEEESKNEEEIKEENISQDQETVEQQEDKKVQEGIELTPESWFIYRDFIDSDEDKINYERKTGTDRISLEFIDKEKDEPISGIKIAITDSKGNIIEDYKTDDNYHMIDRLIVGETYTIHEISVPDGIETNTYYFTMPEIDFGDINSDEYYYGQGLTIYKTNKKENGMTSSVEDKEQYKGSFKVSAQGYENEYISGVKFEVYDEQNNLVDSWESKEIYHEVSNLKDGNYKVKIAAPVMGYDFNWDLDLNTGEVKYFMEYDITIRNGMYAGTSNGYSNANEDGVVFYFFPSANYTLSASTGGRRL